MFDSDIITELLQKTRRTPFSQLDREYQLRIVKRGRPQPSLPELKSEHREKNRTYNRTFSDNNYKRYHWLTGSSKLQKLFCWPCLLFSSDVNPWSKMGFNCLNNLTSGLEKHQRSMDHIRAFYVLQTFGSQRINRVLNLQKELAEIKNNDKMKDIRDVLKRQIDVVTFLGRGCAFGTHGEFAELKTKSMFEQVLELVAKYDPVIANHLKSEAISTEKLPTVQSYLIDAIASEVRDKIKSEISKATFVAFSLDETADIASKSQLATTIRFVDEEGICRERFWSFTDVSSDRTAEGLLKHVIKTVNELNCSEKIVALTFDGAVVMGDHVSGLQTLVKKKYPLATFIHSQSHNLSLALLKSTNSITECRRFFNSLSGMCRFFTQSTSRTTALQIFMERKFPGVSPFRWDFSAKSIGMISEYRMHLVKFFLSIEEDFDNWSGEEVMSASGFVHFLSKLKTKFLLIVFKKIFSFSDDLFDVLKNHCMDISRCIQKVIEVCGCLQKIKNYNFDQIWKNAIDDDKDEYEPAPKKQKTDGYSRYRSLFSEILDTVMSNIKLRFDSQIDLKFASVLDTKNFRRFQKVVNNFKTFSQDLAKDLKAPYPLKFDELRLKNELSVLYDSEEFCGIPFHDITQYMKLNNLDVVFNQVCKLAQLVLTFPSTTASVDRNFSALNRIENYLRVTRGQVLSSNLGLMAIEKGILSEIRKDCEETFFENVILKFMEMSKNQERKPEIANTKKQYVELQPNTKLRPVVQLKLIIGPDPKSFQTSKDLSTRISEPGPSSRVEPDSSMMELDQAMTCEIYPAHDPPPDTLPKIKIKNEPVDPDLYRQDNLSASVVQEVSSVSNESGKQDGSLFQPPALIKDEAVSSEEEL